MSLKSVSLRLLRCTSALCLTVPVVHTHLYPTVVGERVVRGRYAMGVLHCPHPPFSAAGLLRHFKHGVSVTWLYSVAQIPTKMLKFLPRC